MGCIAGIVSSEGSDVGTLLKTMLETVEHRGPDGAGTIIAGKADWKGALRELNIEGLRGHSALGQTRLADLDGGADPQPIQSHDGKLGLLYSGTLYNYPVLASKISAADSTHDVRECEIVLHLLEENYQGDLTAAVKTVLSQLDGVYVLAVTDNMRTVIARDKIGLRQLYYVTFGNSMAFSSEKKGLRAISSADAEVQRLLPGQIATIDTKGITLSSYWNIDSLRSEKRITDKDEAIKAYGDLIRSSVRKSLAWRKHVGIVFSGGIDSLLMACLVREMGVPFTCYTAGRKGAQDINVARSTAAQFGFDLKVTTITLQELKKLIPTIIRTIEDHSLNQVEAAIALYVAARTAQENGEQVIITGQGPDEIFGGYSWYSPIVDQEGYESFEHYSWSDTLAGHKETFERENKIAASLGLEMCVPYMDPAVIELAFRIAPVLKIHRGNDMIQKWIHREFALTVGIPKEIAFRRKAAAQHGANIHTGIEMLAKKAGVTETMLAEAGYDPDRSVVEKLGSSSRYGFRYGDHHLWKPAALVQYFLDTNAAKSDLLPLRSRAQWDMTMNKLKAAGVIKRRA